MSNLVTFNEKTGRWQVPGILLWNSLFQKRKQKGQDGDGKFEINIAVHKSTSLKLLREAALTVGKDRFGKEFEAAKGKWPTGVLSPFKKSGEYHKLEALADEYPVYFGARDSKDRPGVVWPNGKRQMLVGDFEREVEEQDIWHGRNVRIAIDVFAWPKPGALVLKKGVSFGLKAVQLLEGGDEIVIGGGRGDPESEFEGASDAAGGGSADAMFS